MDIDIVTVLRKFDDKYDEHTSEPKCYGIKYRKKGGLPGIIQMARKDAKSFKQVATNDNARGRSFKKFHGTILLFNEESQEYRDIKVAHITAFKDWKSQIWQKVRH